MADPVQYKYLQYNSHKIQVESAIRDGEGATISTNYLKKSMVWVCEYEVGSSTTGNLTQSLSNIPSGTSPRIVQVFEKTSSIYSLIQTDATLSLSDGTWSCTLNKPADSGVWLVRIYGFLDADIIIPPQV